VLNSITVLALGARLGASLKTANIGRRECEASQANTRSVNGRVLKREATGLRERERENITREREVHARRVHTADMPPHARGVASQRPPASRDHTTHACARRCSKALHLRRAAYSTCLIHVEHLAIGTQFHLHLQQHGDAGLRVTCCSVRGPALPALAATRLHVLGGVLCLSEVFPTGQGMYPDSGRGLVSVRRVTCVF